MYFKAFNFFFYITMAAFAYFNIYFNDVGLTSFQIGIVNAIPKGLSLLIMPFWGMATDYFGENKKILMITILGTMFSVLLFPLTSDFYLLLLFMFIYAVFQNPVIPLTDTLLLDYLGSQGEDYGKYRLWGSVGYMVTVLFIGYFLENTRSVNLFYVYATALFIALVMTYFLPASDRDFQIIKLKDALKVFKNKELFVFLIFVFVLQTTMNAYYTYFPLYIVAHGGGELLLGIAMAVAAASEIFTFFASGKILARFKVSNVLLLISVGFCLRWFLLFSLPYMPIIILSQLLHSVTFGLFYATGVYYVNSVTGAAFRATGQNLFAATFLGVSAISGNLIGGFLYQRLGGELMYLIWSVTAFICGIIYYIFMKNKNSKTDLEEAVYL